MKSTPISNTARGEATVTISGQAHEVKFGLRALFAWSQLTGKSPSEFGPAADDNHIDAISGLLSCAVRTSVSELPNFTQEQAIDLMQDMEPAQAEQLAQAIILAIQPDPLTAALRKQVAAKAAEKKAPEKSGTVTSTSPLAS